MKLPSHLHRARWESGIFMVVCGLFFALWVLGITSVVNIGVMNHIAFILSAVIFCLPTALYFGFLTIDRRPMVTMKRGKITFRSHVFPWCNYAISRNDIVDCSTNWEGLNSESWCDLIIQVRPELLQSFSRNIVLRKKNDGLHFEFSTAEVDAFTGVKLVKEYMELTTN